MLEAPEHISWDAEKGRIACSRCCRSKTSKLHDFLAQHSQCAEKTLQTKQTLDYVLKSTPAHIFFVDGMAHCRKCEQRSYKRKDNITFIGKHKVCDRPSWTSILSGKPAHLVRVGERLACRHCGALGRSNLLRFANNHIL